MNYDANKVKRIAEDRYEGDLDDANKMELLGALFEMTGVPFDSEMLTERDWVQSDDLRAVIMALDLEQTDYRHDEDAKHVREYRDMYAPTGDE